MLGVHVLAVLMVVMVYVRFDSGLTENYSECVETSVNVTSPCPVPAAPRQVFIRR
jgi:hypothetical protein